MTYKVCMGDGSLTEMDKSQLYEELESGSIAAANESGINQLSENNIDKLLSILIEPGKVVGVEKGDEVVFTQDDGGMRLIVDQADGGVGTSLSRPQAVHTHERAFATDSIEIGHIDYSFKPTKPIIAQEQQTLENILINTITPVWYGSMPNLGYYYNPDGPFPNPGPLMKDGKIDKALEAQEKAVDKSIEDIEYIAKKLAKLGLDGLNLDTTGAAGDPDFKAALKTTEKLKSQKETNQIPIEIGMAAEYVLGMHGNLKYKGQTLAGTWPHRQAKLAEKAGADIFGPVVNTDTNKSFPWNLARAVTFVKKTTEEAEIPIHVNMGMGVGGIPMFETPPVEAVTRASKSMVEVAGVDGI